MSREEWTQKLLQDGYIDERGAFTMSNIKQAPNGEFGMALLCIKGDELSIYDTDFSGAAKGRLYTIRLPEVSEVKLSTFPFHPTLKFSYRNSRFSFMAGFAKKMPIADVFASLAASGK